MITFPAPLPPAAVAVFSCSPPEIRSTLVTDPRMRSHRGVGLSVLYNPPQFAGARKRLYETESLGTIGLSFGSGDRQSGRRFEMAARYANGHRKAEDQRGKHDHPQYGCFGEGSWG